MIGSAKHAGRAAPYRGVGSCSQQRYTGVFGKKKLANNVRNEMNGQTYFVSTTRMWPLKVWETAVFQDSVLNADNCLYVYETYEPKQVKGLYAKNALEQEADAVHARSCDMVAREPIEKWHMPSVVIHAMKAAAAQNS